MIDEKSGVAGIQAEANSGGSCPTSHLCSGASEGPRVFPC